MEEVLESWKRSTKSPQFKAEGMIHFGAFEPLTAAARAAARRLNMTPQETQALVDRYVGYARELSGKGVKPVPKGARTSRWSPSAHRRI